MSIPRVLMRRATCALASGVGHIIGLVIVVAVACQLAFTEPIRWWRSVKAEANAGQEES